MGFWNSWILSSLLLLSHSPWRGMGFWNSWILSSLLLLSHPLWKEGMGSCCSLVSSTLLLSHPPEGDGILFFPGFMYTIIIIPSPIRGWDLVLPWFHVHYCYYPIPHKGMGSCSSLVSRTLLLLSHPPEGDGILFFPGFMYTIIIIPSPRRGWDLVLPWFHVHYYYSSSSSSRKTILNFGLVFKISQWNLLGTLAMGLIAHILIYGLTCHAVMELWQKMC